MSAVLRRMVFIFVIWALAAMILLGGAYYDMRGIKKDMANYIYFGQMTRFRVDDLSTKMGYVWNEKGNIPFYERIKK